jgi:hypothetical protein
MRPRHANRVTRERNRRWLLSLRARRRGHGGSPLSSEPEAGEPANPRCILASHARWGEPPGSRAFNRTGAGGSLVTGVTPSLPRTEAEEDSCEMRGMHRALTGVMGHGRICLDNGAALGPPNARWSLTVRAIVLVGTSKKIRQRASTPTRDRSAVPGQRHPTAMTSSGPRIPLSETVRGSDRTKASTPTVAAVSAVTRISPPSASAATLAALCTSPPL